MSIRWLRCARYPLRRRRSTYIPEGPSTCWSPRSVRAQPAPGLRSAHVDRARLFPGQQPAGHRAPRAGGCRDGRFGPLPVGDPVPTPRVTPAVKAARESRGAWHRGLPQPRAVGLARLLRGVADPTNSLLEAAGLAKVRLAPLIAAFCAGRLVSYSLYLVAATKVEGRIRDVTAQGLISPRAIVLGVVGV